MATDLDHYITKQKLSNITLLGHSMGGKLAMYYALVRPQNVNKLVIFDGNLIRL
jgi:esterase